MEMIRNYSREFKEKYLHRIRVFLYPANNPPVAVPAVEEQRLDWTLLIMGYCLTSATEIAVQSRQLGSPFATDGRIPLSMVLLSMAMLIAFATTLVAKMVSERHPNHARVLLRIGIFFVAMAFYLAVTATFPLSLKIVSWFIFFASFLVVFV